MWAGDRTEDSAAEDGFTGKMAYKLEKCSWAVASNAGGPEACHIRMRNIILRRLIGKSSYVTMARIALGTWVDHHRVQRHNQLPTPPAADEVCIQLAAEGKSLIITFLWCQYFAVPLSDCSAI